MGINGYLQLNLDGKRFMNEDMPGQQLENQIEKQRGRATYGSPRATPFRSCSHSFPASPFGSSPAG